MRQTVTTILATTALAWSVHSPVIAAGPQAAAPQVTANSCADDKKAGADGSTPQKPTST